jgi:hypothetical protein
MKKTVKKPARKKVDPKRAELLSELHDKTQVSISDECLATLVKLPMAKLKMVVALATECFDLGREWERKWGMS